MSLSQKSLTLVMKRWYLSTALWGITNCTTMSEMNVRVARNAMVAIAAQKHSAIWNNGVISSSEQ